MRKATPLFLAVCLSAVLGPRADAGLKCAMDGHETVIMDNNYARTELQWNAPGLSSNANGGPVGQNDPWSLVNYTATRLGYTVDGNGWTIGATGDFDGNGVCDLAWTRDAGPDTQMTVTLTPATPPRHFVAPEGNPVDLVTLQGKWVMVGSGPFLDASGGPANDGRADLVLWNDVDHQLGVWVDAAHLGGEHRVDGPTTGETRALVVANLDGSGMAEVVWRYGTATALSYWRFGLSGADIVKTGEAPLLAPADANWWLRGSGDFNLDGSDDLIFQNMPNSEKTVIWMMTGVTRAGGAFTQPDLLTLILSQPVIGEPRAIVGPR